VYSLLDFLTGLCQDSQDFFAGSMTNQTVAKGTAKSLWSYYTQMAYKFNLTNILTTVSFYFHMS